MKEGTGAVHAQVPVDVATFLLNEKRQDIHNMEVRFKVNVLLIPNIHLETPNYEVERLRSDSEKLDSVTPSYQMVNRPVEEAVTTKTAEQDTKPARPEPIVKGITPTQPAPIAAEPKPRAVAAPAQRDPAPSLWKRFASLFSSEPAPAPQPAAQPATPAKPARDGRGGSDRARRDGRDGERKRGDRSERGERKDRPQGQSGQQGQDRAPRGERNERNRPEGREPRNDKAADITTPVQAGHELAPQPQKPRQQQQPRAALEAKPVEQGEEGEGRGRRRRGRGGRGGRDGNREGREPRAEQNGAPTLPDMENPANTNQPVQSPVAHVENFAPAIAMDIAPAALATLPEVVSHTPVHSQAPVEHIAVEAPAPAPVFEAMPAPAPAPAPAEYSTPAPTPSQNIEAAQPVMAAPVDQIDDATSIRSTPRPARRRNRDAPPAEPLVFIETVAAPASYAAPVEEEAPRRRTPRPRGPRPVASEPLQFVETKSVSTGDNENKSGV